MIGSRSFSKCPRVSFALERLSIEPGLRMSGLEWGH
jgi:hypothetical protein